MKPSRSEIKAWLLSHDLNYKWLANQCFVTYNTVKNWMSKREIPAAKLALIRQIMSEVDAQPAADVSDWEHRERMELRLSPETRALAEKDALKLGITLSDYCTEAVEWCCSLTNIREIIHKRICGAINAKHGNRLPL